MAIGVSAREVLAGFLRLSPVRGTASPATVPPAVRTVYAPAQAVDLLATVRVLRRGAGDPTFRREPDRPVVWRTVRTPEGGATLRLAQHADGTVHAYAWGDDWSGVDVAAVPLLAETRRRHPGLRLTRCKQVVEMLVAAILEQKVATVDAHRAWAWLIRRHGEQAPGPVLARGAQARHGSVDRHNQQARIVLSPCHRPQRRGDGQSDQPR